MGKTISLAFVLTFAISASYCTVPNENFCLDGAGEVHMADAKVVGRADSGAAIYAEAHLSSADVGVKADAKPDQKVAVPDADTKVSTPDQKVAAPDTKSYSPDAKVVSPDQKVTKPDTKLATADAKAATPDQKVTKPDTKVSTPDAKVAKPDTKVSTPDQKVAKPDTQAPDTVAWQCTTTSDCGSAGKCTYYTCSSAHKCVTNYRAYGYSCTDSDACTTSDVCDGAGTCEGTAKTCASSPGQCYASTGTCSGGTCSYAYKASGTSCSDGYFCTTPDTCDGAGTCSGSAKNCGAGYTCDESSDSCTLTAQTGCADGDREGFVSETTFPYLAGCSGSWSVKGLSSAGSGTAAALCESGWHICLDETDVKQNTPSSMTAAYACKYYAAPSTTSYVFFASRQPSTGFGKCTSSGSSGTNDIFGCGNLGDPPATGGGCTVFNKFGSEDCLSLKSPSGTQTWYCGDNGGTTDNSNELTTVYKTGTSLGGVLCCYY